MLYYGSKTLNTSSCTRNKYLWLRGRILEIGLFGNKVDVRIEYLIMGAVLLIAAAMLIGFNLVDKDTAVIIEAGENSDAGNERYGSSGKTESGEEVEEIPDIKVYIVGCVKKPGIVTLKRGQIIDDAIKAAGGATSEADLENINLAYVINSNLMLRIRAKGEGLKPKSSNTGDSAGSNTGGSIGGSNAAGSGAIIYTDSRGAVPEEIPEKLKININTATVKELDTLPGVGEATAEAIIAFREENGGFKRIEDIMKIPGIKQAKFDKIKDYISVN